MLMRIVADIHEHIPALTRALAEFRARQVGQVVQVVQVVSLGDACT